jgi:hypothetical protein
MVVSRIHAGEADKGRYSPLLYRLKEKTKGPTSCVICKRYTDTQVLLATSSCALCESLRDE